MTPQEMAAAYQSGQRLDQIMAVAHMSRERVRKILVEQGVTIRPPGWSREMRLTPDEIAKAYRSGATLRDLARRAGVADKVVRRVLVDQGIQIRRRVAADGTEKARPSRAKRPGPLGPEELARLRAAVGVEVAR